MIKRIVLARRKAGMTREAFRAHYETSHAPMALRLFPMFALYRRNYAVPEGARLPEGAAEPPYDVVTEIGFATHADHEAFLQRAARPEVRAEVRADEAKFMDLSTVAVFTVELCVSRD